MLLWAAAFKTFRRKVDAKKWLRIEETGADRGEWVDPSAGKVTFATWAETWLESLDLMPVTRANYVSNLKSRVLPTFANAQLAKITPAQVRVWQARLRDDGLFAASVREARQVLSAALDVAVANGLIVRNPGRGGETPEGAASPAAVPHRRAGAGIGGGV